MTSGSWFRALPLHKRKARNCEVAGLLLGRRKSDIGCDLCGRSSTHLKDIVLSRLASLPRIFHTDAPACAAAWPDCASQVIGRARLYHPCRSSDRCESATIGYCISQSLAYARLGKNVRWISRRAFCCCAACSYPNMLIHPRDLDLYRVSL